MPLAQEGSSLFPADFSHYHLHGQDCVLSKMELTENCNMRAIKTGKKKEMNGF
jgi:hypothetical protein